MWAYGGVGESAMMLDFTTKRWHAYLNETMIEEFYQPTQMNTLKATYRVIEVDIKHTRDYVLLRNLAKSRYLAVYCKLRSAEVVM